jgi:hypothetical protein
MSWLNGGKVLPMGSPPKVTALKDFYYGRIYQQIVDIAIRTGRAIMASSRVPPDWEPFLAIHYELFL